MNDKCNSNVKTCITVGMTAIVCFKRTGPYEQSNFLPHHLEKVMPQPKLMLRQSY